MTDATPTPPSGPPEITDRQLIEALGEGFVAYVSATAPEQGLWLDRLAVPVRRAIDAVCASAA